MRYCATMKTCVASNAEGRKARKDKNSAFKYDIPSITCALCFPVSAGLFVEFSHAAVL